MGKSAMSLVLMQGEIMGAFLQDPADGGLKAGHICNDNQYVFM